MKHKARYENISIIGQTKSQADRLAKAFELLRLEEPKYWRKGRTLKKVEIKNARSYDNELYPDKRLWVCDRYVVEKNAIGYLASLLLHEIHHLMQYDRGVMNIDSRAERGAYWAQARFLRKIGRVRDAGNVIALYERKLRSSG